MKQKLAFIGVAVVSFAALGAPAEAQNPPKPRAPVIDMHLHAFPAKEEWPGGPSLLLAKLSRGWLRQADHVRLGRGHVVPSHWHRDRSHRVSRLPRRRAKARHPLQQRGALPEA